MHDRATTSGKLWGLSAFGAAMISATIAVAVVNLARQRPLPSSATSSMEDRRASLVAPPVHHADQPAARAWSTHGETEDDMAPANVGHDASPSPSMPGWLDGGPWAFEDFAAFWEKETLDPEWSANVKEYIYAMLDPEDLNLDVLNRVDCRQTLCRIEMNTAHMPAIVRLSRMASGGGQLQLANKYVRPDGGPAVMVVYTAREDLAERVFAGQAQSHDAGSNVAQR